MHSSDTDAGGDWATGPLDSDGADGALTIEVLENGGVSRSVRFRKDAIDIGRSSHCDLELQDASLSRKHARIERSADGWVVTDLASSNGTTVNGRMITAAELTSGDEVAFGDVTTRVTLSGEGVDVSRARAPAQSVRSPSPAQPRESGASPVVGLVIGTAFVLLAFVATVIAVLLM